jgi:hypothetical protein
MTVAYTETCPKGQEAFVSVFEVWRRKGEHIRKGITV